MQEVGGSSPPVPTMFHDYFHPSALRAEPGLSLSAPLQTA